MNSYIELTLIYDLAVAISILIQDGIDFTFPHRSLQEYFSAPLIKELSDAIKSKVYKERFLQIPASTTEYNFWSLCEELDPYCFKEYFVLYQLDHLIQELQSAYKKSIEIFIRTYIDIFIDKVIINKDEFSVIGCFHPKLSTISLLQYLHVQYYGIDGILKDLIANGKEFCELFSADDLTSEIFLDSDNRIITLSGNTSAELIAFYLKFDIDKKATDSLERLKNYRDKIRFEIENEKQKDISFFNLT